MKDKTKSFIVELLQEFLRGIMFVLGISVGLAIFSKVVGL